MKSTEIAIRAERSRSDGREASAFIREMEPFIRRTASRYMYSGFDEDVYSAALEGFMNAVRGFDYRYRGFIPYAGKAVGIAVRGYLDNDTRLIRIPRYVLDMERRIRKYSSDNPSADKAVVMEKTGVKSLKTFNNAVNASSRFRVTSLDAPIGDGDSTFSDITPDITSVEDEFFSSELRRELWKGIDMLSDTERDIITSLFGLDGKEKMSVVELAECYGVTKVTIQNRKKKAMAKLKSHLLPLVT